ncbi:MAG: zinc ribbon domain-containing protein [Thermoplasmata archaeon]|nr:zinc ribbon domain-containing protein [Thermoplasmata archaeon]
MSEAQSQQPRNCVSCGRSISWDANVCPYCGHDYRAQVYAGQPRGEQISSGVKILFYLLSFFIPLVGFIIGAIYYSKPEPEMKEVGKMCLILAVLAIVVVFVCWGGILGIGLLTL